MILGYVALYLVVGMGALVLFDLLTRRRIRRKLDSATCETQDILARSGNPVRLKTAKVIFFGAMWLFWPMVLVGALSEKLGGKHGKK